MTTNVINMEVDYTGLLIIEKAEAMRMENRLMDFMMIAQLSYFSTDEEREEKILTIESLLRELDDGF